MPPSAPRSLAVLALAVLSACGGSGGGGGGPPVVVIDDATFQGDYFAVLEAGGHAVLAPQGRGATGILLADGAGAALHSQTINDSGLISSTTTPYSFDVAADGTLQLSLTAGVFARGGIAADGECALLGSAATGAFPGIIVLRRRQGFHADASLSGAYRFASFYVNAVGDTVTETGTLTFDGSGGTTGTVVLNSMGLIAAGPLVPGSYSVVADGTSTLNLGGGEVFQGGVVGGGAAGVWGGGAESSTLPGMVVAVKQATSATVATLQGAYWAVALERDPVSDEFRSLHGTATADGAGGLTLLATVNTEGVIAPEPLQSTIYAVTASGQLTIDPAGSALVGGVSQDGSFAAVAGGTTAGSNPILLILRRK